MVYKAQVADTIIHKQQIEIEQLSGALSSSDHSAAAAREATDAAIESAAHLENEVKLQEQKTKYWERLSKKWKRIAVATGVVATIELIVIVAGTLEN